MSISVSFFWQDILVGLILLTFKTHSRPQKAENSSSFTQHANVLAPLQSLVGGGFTLIKYTNPDCCCLWCFGNRSAFFFFFYKLQSITFQFVPASTSLTTSVLFLRAAFKSRDQHAPQNTAFALTRSCLVT